MLVPLDAASLTAFDNAYFSNLLSQKGLLHSDQQLFNGGSTDVRSFASSASALSSAFAMGMGNMAPKTGSQGQIRVTCSKVNSYAGQATMQEIETSCAAVRERNKAAYIGPGGANNTGTSE